MTDGETELHILDDSDDETDDTISVLSSIPYVTNGTITPYNTSAYYKHDIYMHVHIIHTSIHDYVLMGLHKWLDNSLPSRW